jgi:geranylgeranyl pyrophosphate synthase
MIGLSEIVPVADASIVEFMGRVEELLSESAEWTSGLTARTGRETLAAGGKRLRPLLVFLSAPTAGRDREALVRAAVATELVHMATLIHDDVIDRAELRRGRPTVWATEGDAVATTTGDNLFARAFAVLARTGDADALSDLAECALGLSDGEALQMLQSRHAETTPAQYLERCTLKTGLLFQTACSLGGRLGGLEPAAVRHLAEDGRALGRAFQVADDVLDCGGETAATGKPIGTDLLDGTATLPLLLAARADAAVAAALAVQPESFEVLPILLRVAETGALEEAREIALDFVAAALASLEEIDATSGDVIDTTALRTVATSVVDRTG